MPRLRKARALRRGARIGVAAPAGPVDPEALAAGESWLRALDFEPVRRPDVTARDGYLAGDDDRRARELTALVDDPAIEGILCARGGYGCHRIVDRLDPARWRAAAKPLMGYSDVTTLLLWQRRVAGLTGFHGPMLERGERQSEASQEAVGRAFRGESLPALEGTPGVGGRAEGRLVGGSLSLVVASLGTPWALDTRGAILLIEEVGEEPYRVDRLLAQLRHAGALARVVGVGVGQMVGCDGTRYPVPTVDDVVHEALGGLGVPVVTGLPFGHCDHNLPWGLGVRARIDGDAGCVEALESAVRAG